MSAHTPGPWACFFKAKYDEWHVSVPIAESSMKWALFDDGVRTENPEADARLIAAAPDLLAALRECANSLERMIANSRPQRDRDAAIAEHPALQDARAAIAKAEGRG